MSMRPYNAREVRMNPERVYEIIRRPLVTEKSTSGSEHGQVTFVVDLLATKPEIKVAVEQLFGRKVKAVNTLRQKGKVKRFRGRPGRRPDFKKAIVTFEDGAGEGVDILGGI
ncbi:MAG: 50S ribosomal protein L23 [Alphaproteobacteria bacterium]|nr:50S ribosomal protein L23 [Alphaproteobacteria bacterium]